MAIDYHSVAISRGSFGVARVEMHTLVATAERLDRETMVPAKVSWAYGRSGFRLQVVINNELEPPITFRATGRPKKKKKKRQLDFRA